MSAPVPLNSNQSGRTKGTANSQTQLSGRLRLVTTKTLPFALAMGMAQHTTRGTARPLVPIVDAMNPQKVVVAEAGVIHVFPSSVLDREPFRCVLVDVRKVTTTEQEFVAEQRAGRLWAQSRSWTSELAR